MDKLTPSMIVAALGKVKEFHIDLIDLSWKVVKEDGTLDDQKMLIHRKEIEEAADQASAYVTATRTVTARLKNFVERSHVRSS